MELRTKLDVLGLAQYADVLAENGFEDWDTVQDITEEDLDSLGFKRGHRRVLQKEIATTRGSPTSLLPLDSSRSGSLTPTATLTTLESFEKKQKRRYRWHPRPDPNAPKKPKTAYVNFADHLRSDPSIASLSFVDIAREVGKRWQTLDLAAKQDWETRAAQAMQGYEDRMDAYRLTKQHQDYQEYLETFKKAPGKSARQKVKSRAISSLTCHRRSESAGSGRSPSASMDSPPTASLDFDPREECRNSIAVAVDELSRCKQKHTTDRPFSLTDLPREASCRFAIAALLDEGSTIFHLISLHEAESLLHRVYRRPGPIDTLSLIELCALAAAGSHFSRSQASKDLQMRLIATVCYLMEQMEITEGQYLRLMRVFSSLAMHCISEKMLSARCFVAAGLAIARLQYTLMDQDGSREDWKKVYRTLIFSECWLSQTLGTTPQNLHIHFRNVVEQRPNNQDSEDMAQWQVLRVAIISHEVVTALRSVDQTSQDSLRYLAGQLELWQRELPHEMQLATLLSSLQGTSHRQHTQQALLIAHIFCLGAVILLHGQPLVASETNEREQVSIDLTHPRDTCMLAGEQISKLLRAVHDGQGWTPRSWTVLYWAFSASNMLLLGAAQALRSRSTNDYDRLNSNVRTCLTTLESCAKAEPIAIRYLDAIAPIHASLRRLRESPHLDMRRRKSEHRISIKDLLANEDAKDSSNARQEMWCGIDDELPDIMRQVTDLLRDPFGRPPQLDDERNPYPSPPSSADLLFWFRV